MLLSQLFEKKKQKDKNPVINNPVAKFAGKYNRSSVVPDKKKELKKRGWDD